MTDDFALQHYTVTISGTEREDGHAPFTYVVTAHNWQTAVLEVTAADHSPERSRLTVRSTHRPIWVLDFLPDDPVFVVCLFDLTEVTDEP